MKWLYIFTLGYLGLGGFYFLKGSNYEFVVYVAVIVIIFAGVLLLQRVAKFPLWTLWLLSIWGLMHILGGSVPTPDGVLFAYRIYPFIDGGSELYILKYDQLVHFYLYGLISVMSYLLIKTTFAVQKLYLPIILAILSSLGISALNEIMEFLVALSVQNNGVGGYENTLLDLVFNFSGALIAVMLYRFYESRKILQTK